MKGDLNMGEEKKDSLESVMDAVADVVEDYGEVVEEYAYQKAQLDMLKRYVHKNSYVERDMILKLMGWDEDGKH
jgi:hypothetical protein